MTIHNRILLLLVLLLVMCGRHAGAITVINSDDSGAGSLREALIEAGANAGPDTIDFDPSLSGAVITLTDGPLQATDVEGVTVDASALPAGITVNGNNSDRVFYNHSDGNLTLRALTLTGGFQDICCGGAAVLNQGNAVALERCTLFNNTAGYGPAVFTDSGRSTTLLQCTLTANHATFLGGALFNRGTTTLVHCTFAGNSSDGNAGAIYNETGTALTLENCVSGGNTAAAWNDVQNEGMLTIEGANIIESEILHGVEAITNGSGTVTNVAPQLMALDDYGGPTATMLPLAGSPCIDAAVDSTETIDQRGAPRPQDSDGNGSVVADIGAVEVQQPPEASPMLTNLVLSVGTLMPVFDGGTTNYLVGDVASTTTNVTVTPTTTDTNTTITVNGTPVASGSPSGGLALHLGDNPIIVIITSPLGTQTTTYTVNIQLTNVRYVWPGSPNPSLPFGGWDNAAHDIQTAVDAAITSDTVLVTNGIYATGGRVQFGAMTNRVVIDKAVTVISVNGPAATTILGAWDPLTTNGDAAVRCVYVGANAILSGFTLADGACRNRGDAAHEQYGGGAWCEDSAIISNCILSGNAGWFGGGGVFSGTLNGCTLTGNIANEGSGGGAYSTTLNDCLLTSNSAYYGGGSFAATANRCIFSANSAIYGGAKVNGTLNNCLVVGNSASLSGGGGNSVGMNNCTVTGNTAPIGGGVDSALCRNCIVYFNNAASNANFTGATMSTSCTTPDPGGTGNITTDPQFIATNDFHLVVGSPCADAGDNNYAPAGTDLDGHTRVINDIVDMGAYELPPQNIAILSTNGALIASGDATPDLSDGTDFGVVNVLALPAIRTFVVTNSGGATLTISGITFTGSNAADFAVLNSPASVGVGSASNLVVYCTPTAPGLRTATISVTNNSLTTPTYTFALSAFVTNGPATRYVWTNSPSPAAPYTNWQTAAHTIQAAVDLAYVGDHVVVTNGVYAAGGRVITGAMPNRVAVDQVITLESVNGPAVTTIQGAGPNGETAVRCVYLKGGARLSGFTLTGGATRTVGDLFTERSGGGVWCAGNFFAVSMVSNCVLIGNSASWGGGGMYGTYARYNDCTFTNNVAVIGGGLYDSQGSVFSNCTYAANTASLYGGGANSGTHDNGIFTGNTASERGGGTYSGLLRKCRLTGNKTIQSNGYGGASAFGTMDGCLVTGNSSYMGAGNYFGTLRNCTLIGNAAFWEAGGAFRCTIHNCIIYGNTTFSGSSANALVDGGGGSIDFSCNIPLLGGAGNIANDPMVDVTNGYRLAAGSPCRDTGNNGYAPAGTDLDGNPRIVNVLADMGAYEFQSGAPADYDGDGIPSWWEAQKGLNAVVSNSATANADSDWMPDISEYVADTDPNNASSYFPPISLTNSPAGAIALVINPTSSNRIYRVSAATNLLDAPPAWLPVAPEQTGTAGPIVFTITNDAPRRFYHTGVRLP